MRNTPADIEYNPVEHFPIPPLTPPPAPEPAAVVAAPAPVEPAKPDAKPEPAPTLDEALEAKRAEVMASVFGGDKPPKKAKAAKVEPEPEKKADEPAAAAPPAEPEKKKPRKVAPKPEVDEAEITERAAAAATKAAIEAMPKAAPERAVERKGPDITILSEEDREAVPVFQKMEELNPQKYGKLVERLVEYEAKQEKYAEQWEKDHPDEKFNANDEAHDDWHEKHKPAWSQLDFQKAVARIERDSERGEKDKELAELRAKVDSAERDAALRPDLESATAQAPRDIALAINAEFDTPEKLQADPMAAEIVSRATQFVQSEIKELAGLLSSKTPYDPKNPVHTRLFELTTGLEKQVKSLPEEDRVIDGKAFATREQWVNMSPEQRKQHWRFDLKEISTALTSRVAQHAKQTHAAEQKRFEEMAVKNGYVKNGASKTSHQPENGNTAKPVAAKPLAPSPTHAPGNVQPADANSKVTKGSTVLSRIFGG